MQTGRRHKLSADRVELAKPGLDEDGIVPDLVRNLVDHDSYGGGDAGGLAVAKCGSNGEAVRKVIQRVDQQVQVARRVRAPRNHPADGIARRRRPTVRRGWFTTIAAAAATTTLLAAAFALPARFVFVGAVVLESSY